MKRNGLEFAIVDGIMRVSPFTAAHFCIAGCSQSCSFIFCGIPHTYSELLGLSKPSKSAVMRPHVILSQMKTTKKQHDQYSLYIRERILSLLGTEMPISPATGM